MMFSDRALIEKMACPICLGEISWDATTCRKCAAVFPTLSGLPVFLVDDENRRIKQDEIQGEAEFNQKHIPLEVHIARNAFVDRNTERFLDHVGASLTGKELLAVGASMSEILLCLRLGALPIGLDIGPELTLDCLKATASRGLDAGWVCGDGEALPFKTESFDLVMVRQALHHMLKYRSAVSEFFRVLRIGGVLLIVDEPYCGAESVSGDSEQPREYIESTGTPESLLADKYHSLSLPNCLQAIEQHTSDYKLHWPEETAWTDESTGAVQFCTGPSHLLQVPVEERKTMQGNVSVMARKLAPTTVFRDRSGLRPLERPAPAGAVR